MEENKELDFENMTREEALKIMGLGPKAGIKAIEDRFWKMTKQYRGKDDPESLKKEEEFATLYEIATGHRDFVRQQEEERNNSAKFFGKNGTIRPSSSARRRKSGRTGSVTPGTRY